MLKYEQEARLIGHIMDLRKYARELKAIVSNVKPMPDFMATHWHKEAKVVLQTLTDASARIDEASEFLEQLREELNRQQ